MVPALATEGNIPMSKLSDTQSIILSAAAQRADGNVLPLPGSLRPVETVILVVAAVLLTRRGWSVLRTLGVCALLGLAAGLLGLPVG